MSYSGLVTHALAFIGFVYFLFGISNSYLNREVIVGTIFESQRDVLLPSLSYCYDPVFTLRKYTFAAAGRHNKTLRNFYSACQTLSFLVIRGQVPPESEPDKCPFMEFNDPTNKQLSEPFRHFDDVFLDISIVYGMLNQSTIVMKQMHKLRKQMVYRDGLRCYVVTLEEKMPLGALTRFVVLKTVPEQGRHAKRLVVTPNKHLPRGKNFYIPFVSMDERLLLRRVTMEYLSYPYNLGCREYNPEFSSQAHCFETCIKTLSKGYEMLNMITYEPFEIRVPNGTLCSPNATAIAFCTERCAYIDCRSEYFSLESKKYIVSEPKDFRKHSVELEEPLMLIRQAPKTTLMVFIIYICDLFAAFFGFSFYANTQNMFRGVINFRHCLQRWKRLRLKYNIFLRNITKKIVSFTALLGYIIQSHICVDSYLQYETTSETLLQHAIEHPAPKLSLCLEYKTSRVSGKKCTYMTFRERVAEFPDLSELVDRILMSDTKSSYTKYDTEALITRNNVIKALPYIYNHFHDCYMCYLFEFVGTYKTAAYLRTEDTPININVNGSMYLERYGFQNYRIEFYNREEKTPTGYMKIAVTPDNRRYDPYGCYVYQFNRFLRSLLPYPYSDCFDSSSFAPTETYGCLSRCQRQYFFNTSVNLYERTFLDNFPKEYYDIPSLSFDRDRAKLDEQKRSCENKCKMNYCENDNVKMHAAIRKPKLEDYNVMLDPIPKLFTYSKSSAKMTITDLIVYLSGILGVWFGLNFSNLTIYLSNKLGRIKTIFIYSIHTGLIVLFYIQTRDLISTYTNYETVLKLDIKYLDKLVPPTVAMCIPICYFLNMNLYSCYRQMSNLTISDIQDNFNDSISFIDRLAIRNPDNMIWEYKEVHKLTQIMPKYLKHGRPLICFVNNYNVSEYDVARARMLKKKAWFKVKVQEKYMMSISFQTLTQDLRYEQTQITNDDCKPYLYTTKLRLRMRNCENWTYKTNLLPYPYKSDCLDYKYTKYISQAQCYRSCLNEMITIPRINGTLKFYDMTDLTIRNLQDSEKVANRKRFCIKKCPRSDCTIHFSKIIPLEQIPLSETTDNMTSITLETRLYETTYMPSVTFPEFFIYLVTYLGIILGIDALVVKPILDFFECCI